MNKYLKKVIILRKKKEVSIVLSYNSNVGKTTKEKRKMTTNQAEPQAGKSTPWSNDQLIQTLGKRMFEEYLIDTTNCKVILSTEHAKIYDNIKQIHAMLELDNNTLDIINCDECNAILWGANGFAIIPNNSSDCLINDNCNMDNEDNKDNLWRTGTCDWDADSETIHFQDEKDLDIITDVFMLLVWDLEAMR